MNFRFSSAAPVSSHRGFALLLGGLMLLQGCSPKEPDATAATASAPAASGDTSSVSIVRETKPEFPEKTIAAYREIQQRCFEGREVVAKAQGWAFDPKADAMTDAAILALDTQKTEEYFSGNRYAVIVTGTQFDTQKMGVTQELSCKLTSTPFKSVEIRDGECHSMAVEYDLPETTGRRIETKGLCDKPSTPVVDQGGATVAVAGGQQCKWNVPNANNPLHMDICTLLPNPVHAGTGREMVAIQKKPDTLRNAAQVLPGTTALSLQSLVTVDAATSITVGGSIPAAKFEAPADSAGFALTEVK
ncbi:MAG: hypothetical protein EOO28_20930 [Comamonadaceae bacterium]|nr:MAG: hypothetical protein EOO28_20930 [Comamonadaceae bacterium]